LARAASFLKYDCASSLNPIVSSLIAETGGDVLESEKEVRESFDNSIRVLFCLRVRGKEPDY